MESMPVNWEALDALVIDFAKSENLIEDSTPSSSPSSSLSSLSSYHSRLLIRQIRRSLEAGDIDVALDLLRLHAPFALDDHRLLFRLQKQKFVELLRKGTEEDRDAAMNCLRTALAPCALDAYPEAYEEFKHVLLAFIYDKDDQSSPVADEWSETRRFEIAGLLSSVLRANLNAYDPVFSMTLRYLISIHKGFCFRQGVVSPISNLTERLLLEERDPAPIPQESMYEASPFDEVDIQALAHAVELTRQGAVDSLKFAKGDLVQAFQNELCRMKLNESVLDELVHEYCVYRGIVDSANTSQPADVNKSGPWCCSVQNDSTEVNCDSSKVSDDEPSTDISHMDGSPEGPIDVMSTQTTDINERYPSETAGNYEDCSTSGAHQPDSLKVQLRNRNHGIGERNKRKRWRGRHEKIGFVSEVLSGSCREEAESSLIVDGVVYREDKYDLVLAMKELACRGMTAEVVEEINSMDPNFFVQNPDLLFQLKQVEFLKLVGSGDHSRALRVACSHLGPLAARDPVLLRPLKETLFALLRPNEEAFGERLPLHALATSVQVAIGRRFGIDEPQLMKIMKATLYTHNEWFKLQMCKDRFEGFLRISSLKEVGTSLLADAASRLSDTSDPGSSQATMSSSSRVHEDVGSPAQISSSEVACDENAILKVMEFLALPRADAIHLLGQYNGNAELVIQQIFA
ncbi:uncharacterized protein [Coffea arabica]|uniref:CTLH domain-containing protein n=1 Tax=Coffea arabica TaxID=13443 RepID=A0A6P6TBP1_COFAR|nr:uncharacterized protein LOC113699187 [Coffea arabica]